MPRMKLPSGEEMRQWNLIALRQMGPGSRHIRDIDTKIRQMMLGLGVPANECDFVPRPKTDPRNRLQLNAEGGRSQLKTGRAGASELGSDEKGLLVNSKPNQGYWRLTHKGRAYADELIQKDKKRQLAAIGRKQQSQADNQTLKDLAGQAGVPVTKIRLLQKYSITAADLEKLLKERRDAQYQEEDINPEEDKDKGGTIAVGLGSSSYEERLDVERAAIDYILSKEPTWHNANTPDNRNNPGFDLYQTDNGRKNGKKTVWCEVKALSSLFRPVSLTPREIWEAQKRKDNYWLYIVENVGAENPNIIRIQNPAYRTDERFNFGREWRDDKASG